jgi:hypothetical protein
LIEAERSSADPAAAANERHLFAIETGERDQENRQRRDRRNQNNFHAEITDCI